MRSTRTKLIASIGPSSSKPHVVEQMARLGVTGFRVNFAHGDEKVWSEYVDIVREVEKRTGRPLALIGDLVGASVRLGEVDKPLTLRAGDLAYIVLSEKGCSEKREIPLPNPRVFYSIDVGDIIVMDDGRVRLSVIEKRGTRITVRAITDARITSRKALVVQGKEFELPSLSQRDIDNVRFAVDKGFDYIGLSYVKRAEDIETLRGLLEDLGAPEIGIIAKIETRSAVENLEKIVDVTDVVLVARGDLGMVFGLEKVPWLQTRIVTVARRRGKPVIVATQLLESMLENPVPTRAEVNDIVTAVKEGVDALMLTGETSIGRYPIEAVDWLRRVVEYAESMQPPVRIEVEGDATIRFAKGVVALAEDTSATLLVYTMRGNLPRAIAAERPRVPVYAGAKSLRVARKLSILWGIEPIPLEAQSYSEGVEKLLALLCREGYIGIGENVLESFRISATEQHIVLKKVTSCPP